MAEITAALVKELREKTGAGMMDCKKALAENNGDLEAAVDWLRTKGLAAAAKKAGRVAAEGLVGVVIDGNKGAVCEVNAETDFVARNEGFQDLVESITKLAIDAGDDVDGPLPHFDVPLTTPSTKQSPRMISSSVPGFASASATRHAPASFCGLAQSLMLPMIF